VLLEMRDARFAQRGADLAGPQNLQLAQGARLAHPCNGNRAAAIVAMMAAGLVRATHGSVFVGAFDPRIQPVHVKRLAGYVPHDALPQEFPTFDRYIEYRAALRQLSASESIVRARHMLDALEGIHESFAYPLAGALIAQPELLVLDRPQALYAPQIMAVTQTCAVFSTHGSQSEAQRFAAACSVPA
jgi:ABC-type Na+ transport system ATPase subunit NatA